MSDVIGFFDGFNGLMVGIAYAVLIAFSVAFTIFKMKCMKIDPKTEEIVKQSMEDHNNKINVSSMNSTD